MHERHMLQYTFESLSYQLNIIIIIQYSCFKNEKFYMSLSLATIYNLLFVTVIHN